MTEQVKQPKVRKVEVINGLSDETLAALKAKQPEQAVLDQVQYVHDQLHGKTYAVVPPSKDSVIEAMRLMMELEGNVHVKLHIGRASLNQADKDQYVKEYGRLISGSKLKVEEFELTNVNVNDNRINFTLSRGDETLVFFVRHDRDVPFLNSLSDSRADFYNYAKREGKESFAFRNNNW